jgi:predicted phage-related endonuclease
LLTAAQIAARKGKLGASDVRPLMTSDEAGIRKLWLEKTGQVEPDDLSRVWPIALGVATEPLQIEWYLVKHGGHLSRMGEVVQHPKLPWAVCTLDAWVDELECPFEAKHLGGREPIEVIIDRYQPQFHWQMGVTGASQVALSAIFGANEPIIEFIERDQSYLDELFRRGAQFMRFVKAGKCPVALEPVPSPAPNSFKDYDMRENNQWCSEAFVWLESRNGFERCRDSEKVLKSLVPADAKKCHGANVQITRDRAGRLSLREEKT